jgi:uncharacterized protein
MPKKAAPFWKTKSLAQMSEAEWESLCDGCGRCCLIKLEDEDTGAIHHTDIVCSLFDPETCRCGDYANRDEKVPDCVRLTPENIPELRWMPESCAYRLLSEGKDLPNWHPLVSGTSATVLRAGASVKGRISGFEHEFALADLIDHIEEWPKFSP